MGQNTARCKLLKKWVKIQHAVSCCKHDLFKSSKVCKYVMRVHFLAHNSISSYLENKRRFRHKETLNQTSHTENRLYHSADIMNISILYFVAKTNLDANQRKDHFYFWVVFRPDEFAVVAAAVGHSSCNKKSKRFRG